MPDYDRAALLASIEANAAPVVTNGGIMSLVAHALTAGEGRLIAHGALVVETGVYTGRSP